MPVDRDDGTTDVAWQVKLPHGSVRYRSLVVSTSSESLQLDVTEVDDWKIATSQTATIDVRKKRIVNSVDGKKMERLLVAYGLEVDLGSSIDLGEEANSDRTREAWGIVWRPPLGQQKGLLRGSRYANAPAPKSDEYPSLTSTTEETDVVLVVCDTCRALRAFGADEMSPGAFQTEKSYSDTIDLSLTTANAPWSWLVPSARWASGLIGAAALTWFLTTLVDVADLARRLRRSHDIERPR